MGEFAMYDVRFATLSCSSPIANRESQIPNHKSQISFLLFLFFLLRLATLDLFAFLQIAADGLVTAGNHLPAFLQALEDLRVIVIADPPLDRHHPRPVALRQ